MLYTVKVIGRKGDILRYTVQAENHEEALKKAYRSKTFLRLEKTVFDGAVSVGRVK